MCSDTLAGNADTRRLFLQPSYTTTAMDNDYALVTLANPATSGYLSLFFPPSNGSTETTTLTTAGYPGSKPSGTMWSSACGSTTIDYSDNNAFANVQQCAGGVSTSSLHRPHRLGNWQNRMPFLSVQSSLSRQRARRK